MIRCARIEDLPQIARLHLECFPDSFSSVLGKGNNGKLLENYYYEYLSSVPELFFVAENENKEIVGICMGYYCEKNDYAKIYLKHNFFKICLRMFTLLLSGNKMAWNKIMSLSGTPSTLIVNKEIKEYNPSKKGDLLSICVSSECRGTNTARDLVNEFLSVLQKQDRRICLLSVKSGNARAINFYKKMGFDCYMQTESGLYMFKFID